MRHYGGLFTPKTDAGGGPGIQSHQCLFDVPSPRSKDGFSGSGRFIILAELFEEFDLRVDVDSGLLITPSIDLEGLLNGVTLLCRTARKYGPRGTACSAMTSGMAPNSVLFSLSLFAISA